MLLAQGNSQDKNKCDKCGTSVKTEDNFCPRCSNNLNKEDNQKNYFELCKKAHSLYLKGKDREAVALYKRAITINPSHPLAHEGIGLIHHTNAQKIYREYSMFPGGDWLMFGNEMSPEEDEDNRILGTSPADLRFGNRKIAIKEFEEAANLSNDIADKVYLLHKAAEIHCIIDIEDGIKAYEQILHIAPDNVPAHFHLAGCYATSYGSYKRESPTNSYYKRFSANDKLALNEYKYIKENAPKLAPDLESILSSVNININE